MRTTVAIIGGGLAGLAAAAKLGGAGFAVTLLEARPRLGGRASSFPDPASGTLIDTCQHVSMGCCTEFADFCKTLGLDGFLQRQNSLYFMTPDRRVSRFRADPFPAPLHLARSFASAHYLTWSEKLRIAYGLARLALPRKDDPPFAEWLAQHRQTPRTIARFWGLVLVSALNEDPQRVGLRYARKVFLDGFLRDRTGFDIYLPTVPLGRFYGDDTQRWLQRHGVDIKLQTSVRRIEIVGQQVQRLELRDGQTIEADWYVSAAPFDRLRSMLPDEVVGEPYFHGLARLEASPITSVHAWFDRRATSLPHVVLVDCVGQWVFPRGETAPGEHYVQVVVSAARQFQGLGKEEVERRIVAELRALFPALTEAKLLRARVITEHAATFSAVPGVDAYRPDQRSPITNLMLAGDWTQTGWPATMEGAVRSGRLAAAAILDPKA